MADWRYAGWKPAPHSGRRLTHALWIAALALALSLPDGGYNLVAFVFLALMYRAGHM